MIVISAKRIGWVLVAATFTMTGIGAFVPELGLAVSSFALGGAALAVSVVARVKIGRFSEKESRVRMESEALA
jgi:hypothetical protein